MSARLIVCYDAADDRRRQRLSKALLGYGTRIEESVFECLVDEYSKVALIAELRRISAEWPEDRIHVVELCSRCAERVVTIGGAARASAERVYVV